MLIESNSDSVVEDKESQKPTDGVKSKEIDYEIYLPARFLVNEKKKGGGQEKCQYCKKSVPT